MRKVFAANLTFLLFVVAAFAQHPNLQVGFKPEQAYQVGEIDSVDLFNGTVSLQIPIGQSYPLNAGMSYGLSVSYNSKVWEYGIQIFSTCQPPYDDVSVPQAFPSRRSNAGLGFRLSLGDLNPPWTSRNAWAQWVYVSPDGAEHRFYQTLLPSETDTDATVWYTRDNSYLRLKLSNPATCNNNLTYQTAVVEFPDGSRHTFETVSTCSSTYLLRKIEGPFRDGSGNPTNWVAINYAPVGSAEPTQWTISDSHGRTHTVTLSYLQGVTELGPQVSQVQLQAFGGQVATYTFSYTVVSNLLRSGKHQYTAYCQECFRNQDAPPNIVAVPLLQSISLPDGSSWSFTDANGSLGYNILTGTLSSCVFPSGTPKDIPGTLTTFTLPTLGRITYQYGEWQNPSGSVNCYDRTEELALVQKFLGVTSRTFTNTFSNLGGTVATAVWSYSHDAPRLANGDVDDNAQESWTVVTDPNGNKTKHYFRTKYCLGSDGSGWDYGLPFTRGRNGELSVPPFPSVEYYQGNTLVRSVAVEYEKDTLTLYNGAPPAFESLWHDSNRRVKTRRITYHDDGNRFVLTTFSNYDGLGHYRRVNTSTNIPTSGLSRTQVTNYNPAGRPAESAPWILTTFLDQSVEEIIGGQTKRALQEFCFDPQTGFLQRVRVLSADSGVRSTNDVIRVYARDTFGNTISEELYGGDTQAVGTVNHVCSIALPSPPVSRLRHTYQYGTIASSVVENPNNGLETLRLFSRTIDRNTGLVASEQRTDGFTTTFAYDPLGRLTWTKPQTGSDAWIGLQFTKATASAPGKVDVFVMPNGNGAYDTNAALMRLAFEFDGFGRVFRESRRLPGAVWVKRMWEYNGLGWVSRVSEWFPFSATSLTWTTTSYDRFGRPLVITGPDQKQTTFSYAGIRQISRAVQVATSGGEVWATRTESYDGFGRLLAVSEPSGSNGAMVTSSYSYDVGGRLVKAVTPVGGVTQTRAWNYDQRGFLLGEQLPETGTITYGAYDARGLVGRRVDGASEVVSCYDFVGRLTVVALGPFNCQSPDASRVLKEFTYGSSGVAAGKLTVARRHNRTAYGDEVVEERYTYGGRGGRLSQKQTILGLRYPAVETRSYTQAYTWDELGNVVNVGYPDDAAFADPARSVSLSYSQGYLTGIPGFMTSQSYHANGMVAQRMLANGVREEYGLNADAMARWGRMRVFSPANQQLWDSGSYEYDGAGNIKAMVRSVADKDSYSYDLVSRLVLANFKAGGNAKQAQFTYDEAGNLKGETTTDYGTRQFAVDASRNRISGCGYDGAGRVTSCGGLSFSWSALGELFGVQGTGINRSFLYTADGERIAVRNHLGGTVAVWLRELGGNPLRVYLRTSTGSWSWSRDDVWVGREQVASVYASGVQYVHSDHLGSPRKVTDSLGNVVASNDFYPFGLPAATTGLQGSWFSGYELEHQNTSSTYTDDLYFLHARWYFPQVARFLSPDPVRGNHRAPQSFNLFAYVGGNPINFVDPWGLAEAEPLKINYSETVEVSAGGDPCPFAPKNISCEAWQSVKEMQWRMILGWNRPTSRTPVLSATPAPPIMRAARPEEMGWVSSESEADWGTLYGSYGGFLGLELAVAAEVGVYISTNPWDLVLYLQVGAGRGYGAASGWNVGYVMPGISFESLQAQATLAANRAPGASMSFFRREPAGFSVGFRGRGAGLNAVATKTFTVFSARHLAESIYTAVRFGY